MSNIKRETKRFIACGCSHGHFIDAGAARDFMSFKRDYKPSLTLHLGDFLDQTAFRAGACGTPDESSDISEDVIKGLHFVEAMEPDILFCGNHDDRAFRLAQSNKSVVAHAARTVVANIEDLAEKLDAELVPYTGTYDPQAWRMIGDIAFGHGFMYGMNACEAHVNLTGENTCFVHTHAVDVKTCRTLGGKTGYNIGCIADIDKLGQQYAGRRLKTSTWCNAWAYGEYGSNWCNLEIHRVRKPKPTIPKVKG